MDFKEWTLRPNRARVKARQPTPLPSPLRDRVRVRGRCFLLFSCIRACGARSWSALPNRTADRPCLVTTLHAKGSNPQPLTLALSRRAREPASAACESGRVVQVRSVPVVAPIRVLLSSFFLQPAFCSLFFLGPPATAQESARASTRASA